MTVRHANDNEKCVVCGETVNGRLATVQVRTGEAPFHPFCLLHFKTLVDASLHEFANSYGPAEVASMNAQPVQQAPQPQQNPWQVPTQQSQPVYAAPQPQPQQPQAPAPAVFGPGQGGGPPFG